jgi:NADH-quinone oxidoreductase subunit I
LNLWERLYLPAIAGGFKVTLRHFFKRKVTMQYPEEKWVVPEGYRGAPYLVRDQEGNTKCVSCQLCEFVCPPKAIKIIPPGPAGQLADRPNAEKMPAEFEINMLTGTSRAEMIYDKEKLLALGGVHGGVQKWKHKLEEAKEQENFPVKE